MKQHGETASGTKSTATQTVREHPTCRHTRLLLLAACSLAVGAGITGCSPIGSRQLPIDRFDYNSAISSSANEQMLLNLVRLHHSEVPTFLSVNSVITQYIWSGEAGIAGSTGENLSFPAWSVGGSVNARYIERPTVTYSPLSGQEFASQLISPVRADVVFSLVSSGWPPVQLLHMTLQRINDVQNFGFAESQDGTRAHSEDFARVVELIVQLATRGGIELVRAAPPEREELYLEFSQTTDASTQALIHELKDKVGLDQGLSRFHVTRKILGRAPGEVTIRMHSLLELMGLLSSGVETANQQSTPTSGAVPAIVGEASKLLKVHCRSDRPENSFVAVQYAGKWFELASADEQSKRAFGLLIYLFQMQASQNSGAGPLITVPIG